MIVIESQHPPLSLNLMFRNVSGRGRVKTKRYKEWLQAAGWDFNGKGSHKGPFMLVAVINPKHRRKGSDLDNRLKCCLDALKTHGIIEDDSLCEEIHVRYGSCSKAFRLEVWEPRDQL